MFMFVCNVFAKEVYFVNLNGVELDKEEYEELVERFGEGYVLTSSQSFINEMLNDKEATSIQEENIERVNYRFDCSSYQRYNNYGDFQQCFKGLVHPSNKDYTFELFVEWNSSSIGRMVKSFDILAMNLGSNFILTEYKGKQTNDKVDVNYSNKGGNSKWASNNTAAAISMNIMDDTSEMLTMTTTASGYFKAKKSSTIKSLYIHANRDVTLAQSQSFTFDNDGLGGVLTFNNSTIRSYYQAPAAMSYTLTPEYIK